MKKQLDLGFMEHILKQLFSSVFGTPRDTLKQQVLSISVPLYSIAV